MYGSRTIACEPVVVTGREAARGDGKRLIEDWRAYVTRHRLVVAIVAGLVATHVTTNLGMWYHGIGLSDLNFNILNGLLVFGNAAKDSGKDGMRTR